jgi:hypothetical protein
VSAGMTDEVPSSHPEVVLSLTISTTTVSRPSSRLRSTSMPPSSARRQRRPAHEALAERALPDRRKGRESRDLGSVQPGSRQRQRQRQRSTLKHSPRFALTMPGGLAAARIGPMVSPSVEPADREISLERREVGSDRACWRPHLHRIFGPDCICNVAVVRPPAGRPEGLLSRAHPRPVRRSRVRPCDLWYLSGARRLMAAGCYRPPAAAFRWASKVTSVSGPRYRSSFNRCRNEKRSAGSNNNWPSRTTEAGSSRHAWRIFALLRDQPARGGHDVGKSAPGAML